MCERLNVLSCTVNLGFLSLSSRLLAWIQNPGSLRDRFSFSIFRIKNFSKDSPGRGVDAVSEASSLVAGELPDAIHIRDPLGIRVRACTRESLICYLSTV